MAVGDRALWQCTPLCTRPLSFSHKLESCLSVWELSVADGGCRPIDGRGRTLHSS